MSKLNLNLAQEIKNKRKDEFLDKFIFNDTPIDLNKLFNAYVDANKLDNI